MSIQYNVTTLVREPIGSTRDYDIDGSVLVDEETPAHRRVTGRTNLTRTKDGVLVTAHLEGIEREQCSRCLRPIEVPVHVDIQEEYLSSVDPFTGKTLPAPEDEDAYRIDKQNTINVEEAVRQSWNVSLPMQPLCRPDCKGLCQYCGKDLNEGACACVPEPDERWGALRRLAGKEGE